MASVRGTSYYYPSDVNWLDGSYKWDMYSLGVIILEYDLQKDALANCQTDKQLRKHARNHIKRPEVCSVLKMVMERTILADKDDEMISIQELKDVILKIDF